MTNATLRALPRRVSETCSSAAAASAAVTPGTTSTWILCVPQKRNFFVRAAEQHRVAALEAHHHLVLARGVDELLVDERLRGRMPAAALADLYELAFDSKRKNLLRHQRVVENDVGALRAAARRAA